MVTVLRAHGLRVVIFINDHRLAKINLSGPGGTPELIWADNMSRGDLRPGDAARHRATDVTTEALEGAPWKN